HVPARSIRRAVPDGLRPLDPDDLGAHVGEHHRGERARADPGQLDDADAGQRPGHGAPAQATPATPAGVALVASTISVKPRIAPVTSGHTGDGRSWPMSATMS